MAESLAGRLKSSDATVVANALWQVLVEESADILPADLMWRIIDTQSELDAQKRQQAFEGILASIRDAETLTQAVEFFARMGHFYNLAALIARQNYVDLFAEGVASHSAAHSVRKYANGHSANELAEIYSRPRLEITLTAHPTNVNTRDFMWLLQKAGDKLTADVLDESELRRVVYAVAHTSMTPDGNFSAAEETRHMLYYLENIWNSIPALYADFDEALSEHDSSYDPWALHLNIRLHSWGSGGDKDGNKKITAASTAQARVMHLEKAQWLIASSLRHPDLRGAPELPDKETYRSEAERSAYLQDLMNWLRDQRGNHAALTLCRRLEIFGLTMGHIEYRETAEEHEKIMADLPSALAGSGREHEQALSAFLGGTVNYLDADPAERIEILRALLRDKQGLREAVAEKMAVLSPLFDEATGLPRDGVAVGEADKVFYTTVNRLILARDNPDMIKNYVMAECKGAANMLELVVLCEAVADEGRKPMLGVVPLFESPEELVAIKDIMREALSIQEYAAYRDQVQHYRESTGEIERGAAPIQQVQIAHSDTGRRAGMAASRSFIYQAHENLRSLEDELGVTFQFFEGGGISDPFRGGVRSLPSLINEYRTHDFAKFTFQGGDGMNYFNIVPSSVRLFERVITHMAEVDGLSKSPDKEQYPPHDATERRINKFLQDSLDNYRGQYFGFPDADPEDPEFGYNQVAARALQVLFDYTEGRTGGTLGTRAGGRKAGETEDFVDFVNGVRTIGYSEAYQHGGFDPALIGAFEIGRDIGTAYPVDARNGHGKDTNIPHPQALFEDYLHSPIMREVIDRYASAVIRTFPNEMWQRALDRGLVTEEQRRNANASDPRGLTAEGNPGQQMANYIAWLEQSYQAAAKMAYTAQTGEWLDTQGRSGAELNVYLRNQVLSCYPNLWDVGRRHEMFGAFPRMAKVRFHELAGVPQHEMLDEKKVAGAGGFLRAFHGAMDSLTYSRSPEIDDNIFRGRFAGIVRHDIANNPDEVIIRIVQEAERRGVTFVAGTAGAEVSSLASEEAGRKNGAQEKK